MLTSLQTVFVLILLAAYLLFVPTPSYAQDDMTLRQLYTQYNREWFGNSLPPNTSVQWKDLGSHQMGETDFDGQRFTILITPRIKAFAPAWKLTLFHEMAHIATWKWHEEDPHGPRWTRLMRRLAAQGAFDRLM